MLTVEQRINDADTDTDTGQQPIAYDATLTLGFEQRQKSRLRARLDDATEIGLLLPRGTMLRDGDRLRASDGRVILVKASREKVSTVSAAKSQASPALLLARAAYHLGNRHVPLQLGPGWLRYRPDHVLDAMCRQLGLQVRAGRAPFEPEAGAYAAGHAHARAHEHEHEHHHPR